MGPVSNKGKKAKLSSDSVKDLGLSEQSRIEGGSKMMLRYETSEATQRPEGHDKTIHDERGTFKDKC